MKKAVFLIPSELAADENVLQCMKLIQIFLPLTDNDGDAFPKALYDQVKDHLANQYQGVTVFTQNPAEGLWQENGAVQKDRIVIYEVIAPELNEAWWQPYKAKLEKLFKQDEILIRCSTIEIL